MRRWWWSISNLLVYCMPMMWPQKMFHLIFTDPTPAWWKKCLEANGKSGQSVNTICPARSVARKRKPISPPPILIFSHSVSSRRHHLSWLDLAWLIWLFSLHARVLSNSSCVYSRISMSTFSRFFFVCMCFLLLFFLLVQSFGFVWLFLNIIYSAACVHHHDARSVRQPRTLRGREKNDDERSNLIRCLMAFVQLGLSWWWFMCLDLITLAPSALISQCSRCRRFSVADIFVTRTLFLFSACFLFFFFFHVV